MKKIKVLVVDDSALMRKIISDMIDSQNNMEVIGTARNGKDLFNKIGDIVPDVITLDVEMPIMDGIQVLKEIKIRGINIPVIVLSSFSKKSSELTMECLQRGAFDFLLKPSGNISLDIDKIKDELITKINLASKRYTNECSKNNIKTQIEDTNLQLKKVNKNEDFLNLKIVSKKKIDMVVIGASTGGPKALHKVITSLPKDLGVPVLVVQHMPATFTKAFANRLDANSKLKVVEAKDMEIIEKNKVYIAPGGYHMQVEGNNKIHLSKEPPIWGVRPAVDKLFISASKIHKGGLLSVVLTGMGKDGAEGTINVKENGGITISEDESTCTIYGMPKATFETGKVDVVLPIYKICDYIVKIVKEGWR